MIKVVLDTNVLISALLKEGSAPAMIVSLLRKKQFLLCLSQEILEEYKAVLQRKRFSGLRKRKEKEIAGLFAQIESEALWVTPKAPSEAAVADPDDAKFVQSALDARADFLVTGNTKHFLLKKFQNTRVVTPREFVEHIVRVMLVLGA
ncbi:MAG TPA: putative toxin-antitoxin system toxin component, PIN family, partial [Syntrophorhabdales bacterium]|nr:putative toxin-antitoxin system toxin component, PIN family [Syntrophorhabdales bacterium]